MCFRLIVRNWYYYYIALRRLHDKPIDVQITENECEQQWIGFLSKLGVAINPKKLVYYKYSVSLNI